MMTELSYAERVTVICEEKAPILKMAMTPDQSSIWVATSESTINNWVKFHSMAINCYKKRTSNEKLYLSLYISVHKSKRLARVRTRRLL